MEKICGSLRTMNDAAGLIIDLRGNPGGIMNMASGISGLLTTKIGLIGSLQTRKGKIPLPTFPQNSPFTGSIVILIDKLSGSAAEILAASLQESGRAIIVGERSAGLVLGADTIKLPTGALFMFARTGFKTPEGVSLEGHGVTPDVEQKLDRESLLQGQDAQLEAAVRQIQLRKQETAKSTSSSVVTVTTTATLVEEHKSPPAKAAQPERASTSENHTPHRFESTPQAERIMERYIQAIGGREAIEKLKSRVSTGTCSFSLQNLTGKVALYEQTPDKKSFGITIPNIGTIQIGFNGAQGWMSHPLMGFIEYKESTIPSLKREFDLHKEIKYKERFVKMDYKGVRETDYGKVDVIVATNADGLIDELHFDINSGLLVHGSGAFYGDYRQIGQLKVPFLTRISIAGLDMVIHLEEVNQDISIAEMLSPHRRIALHNDSIRNINRDCGFHYGGYGMSVRFGVTVCVRDFPRMFTPEGVTLNRQCKPHCARIRFVQSKRLCIYKCRDSSFEFADSLAVGMIS
ncbi:MAG: hypothetical protein NVSMB56_05720 [Pyrinomonadaceae bacterium]